MPTNHALSTFVVREVVSDVELEAAFVAVTAVEPIGLVWSTPVYVPAAAYMYLVATLLVTETLLAPVEGATSV
jgi:hypothetical protein